MTRRQVEDALKMKVDLAIPDLPRQVGSAALLGEPAIGSSGNYRNAILELARQVAFIGLLDAESAGVGTSSVAARGLFSLFRRRT
jgi:pilus assembly protein CpaE